VGKRWGDTGRDRGFNQSLDQVLKTLQWGPPNKPEVQARVDRIVTMEHKRLEAIARGEDPGGAARACTFGYPAIMLDSPLMFEVLPTPKETTLIFSSVKSGTFTRMDGSIRRKTSCGQRPGVIRLATGRGRLSSSIPSRSNLLLVLRSRKVSLSWRLETSRANRRSPC